MIEGRHYRSTEARNRTLREAIDRYFTDELGLPEGANRRTVLRFVRAEEAAGREPKKRDIPTRFGRLLWWRERLGSVKLAEITHGEGGPGREPSNSPNNSKATSFGVVAFLPLRFPHSQHGAIHPIDPRTKPAVPRRTD